MNDQQLKTWIERYENDGKFRQEVDQNSNHPFRIQAYRAYRLIAGLTGLRFQECLHDFTKLESDLKKEEILPNRWDWYDQYLSGSMDEAKKKNFEIILSSNPTIQSELNDYSETEVPLANLQSDMAKTTLLSRLETLESSERTIKRKVPNKTIIRRRWIGIAASILILIAIGINIWPSDNINLEEEFIPIEEFSFRDQSGVSPLQEINLSNLDNWINQEDTLLNKTFKYLYGAHLQIESGLYQNAIGYLDLVIASNDSRYTDLARWNKALCLLEINQIEEGKALLQTFLETNTPLANKARKIIKTYD